MGRASDLYRRLREQGESVIDEFISERKAEELFLDFKGSANDGDPKFHHNDRARLAKAISGFGNSEGGVLVWGVECEYDEKLGDVPTGKRPIVNPKRFVSWLEAAVTGCTLPPHKVVQH